MKKNRIEEQHQVAFVQWFRIYRPEYAKLLTLGSFGENVGERRMARLKQMGLTPGFPDLFLAVPVNNDLPTHFGLYIEMKKKGGKVSAIQKEIHELLRAHGYAVHVAYDWDEAVTFVKEYLM